MEEARHAARSPSTTEPHYVVIAESTPYAPEMDDVLHHERLRGGAKRLHRRNIDELPDGAFAAFGQTAFAIQGDTLLRWMPARSNALRYSMITDFRCSSVMVG